MTAAVRVAALAALYPAAWLVGLAAVPGHPARPYIAAGAFLVGIAAIHTTRSTR